MRSRRGTTEVVIRSSRSTRSGCGSKLGTYVGRASALGTGFPPGGRSPSGGKDHFFFCGKRNGPSPKEKVGARSTGRFRVKTAACVFTPCLGTSPGRYGHAIGEQGRACSSIRPPPGRATLAAECGRRTLRKSPPLPHGKHPTNPALREAPAGGGGLEAPTCPCSPRAGRNGRKGSSMSYESRQPPFSPISPA